MERVDAAERMFRDGFSCAQSLAASFGPGLGLARTTALRLASPLAGGLSRTDGPCGAALGALLVLGLARGADSPDDDAAKARIRDLSREFLRRYRERQGSVLCTDILGHDLSRPGVAEHVKAAGLADATCPAAVRTAGEILLELLEGEPRQRGESR